MVSVEKMFENVDRRMDMGVIGILIAHLRAFGSVELKLIYNIPCSLYCSNDFTMLNKSVSRAKNSGEHSRATIALLCIISI